MKRRITKQKPFKKGQYAAVRAVMAEYGFRLQTVMCGKIVDGRYILTYKRK